MKSDLNAGKLERIARTITTSLTELPVAARAAYEYTAANVTQKKTVTGIDGIWAVVSHTVGDEPYASRFANNKFGTDAYDTLEYESTFEFANGLCVKRMHISALVTAGNDDNERDDNERDDGQSFEYDLTLAFAYRQHATSIDALPLIGYQVTKLNGEISAMKELPRSASWLTFNAVFGDGSITITDGDDVKTLKRANR